MITLLYGFWYHICYNAHATTTKQGKSAVVVQNGFCFLCCFVPDSIPNTS